MANRGVLYYSLLQQDRITGTNIQTTTNGVEAISIASTAALSVGDIFTLNNYAGTVSVVIGAGVVDCSVNAVKNIAYRDPVVGDTAYWLDGTKGLDVIVTKKIKATEFAEFGEWKSVYNQKDQEFIELLLPPYYDGDLRNSLSIALATAPALVYFDCDTSTYWKLVSGDRSIESVAVFSQPKLRFEVIL